MSFEQNFRSSVDEVVAPLVEKLINQAAKEREDAVNAVRATALQEAEAAAQARIAEAEAAAQARVVDAEAAAQARIAEQEARLRADTEQAIFAARLEERDSAARDERQKAEREFEPRMAEAIAAADLRWQGVMAQTEARAAEELKAAVDHARAKERETGMAAVTRLLESVRGLDGATTLSEVLDALALAAGREAARAGVLVLRGDRVQGWKLTGFGSRDAQPKLVDMPLNESGILGLAVGSARIMTTRDHQVNGAGPGFEELPPDHMGLAVPVIVQGRVVAVVYADAVTPDHQDRPAPSSWPELIEVLARHAGRCLEALTAQRTAAKTPTQGAQGTSSAPSAHGGNGAATASPSQTAMMQITDGVLAAAQLTARLLVSEIRLFNEPAVNDGRREGNLLSRLAPEIERARQAYNERVPAVVRGETDYFQQELIRTLAGGDASLLGSLV